MGTTVCVGFESARRFWRSVGREVARANPPAPDCAPLLVRLLFDRGEGVDLGPVPGRSLVTQVPRDFSGAAVARFVGGHLEPGELVDVCVSQQAGRHVAAHARVHLMTGSYPTGSFCRVDDEVLVSSPELTFLQVARSADEDLLVAYGCELCGYYARDDVGAGFVNCAPLTSRKRIGAFLDRLDARRIACGDGPVPGIARARRALCRVCDGAASPEESIVWIVLMSPRRRGGFALPEGRMNVCVRLSRQTAELFGIDLFVCDISWDDGRTVLEYQGSQHKLRARHTFDLRKGNVLAADERTLIKLDRAMLGRQDFMEEVAKSLSKALALRWHAPDARLRTRQARLRNKLLVDLEGRGGPSRQALFSTSPL